MKDSLKRILVHFGIKAQLTKTVEECAELIKAIAKCDKENIIEEIADVEIMTEQIKIAFGIDEEVKRIKRSKVQRTLSRIKNSKS